MIKSLLPFLGILMIGITTFGQNTRTIDGTSNNLQNPYWGSAGAELATIVSIGFSDGYSSPAGANRTNPRMISNALFAQNSPSNDPLQLSDYTWVFGQFLDHDITAIGNNPTEPANIPVNFPDDHFNPGGIFQNISINMSRSETMEGTGTAPSNPRKFPNAITSWIDGSGVYGSDIERADWLRTFSDGKLKTSSGNLLPYNTTTNEFDGEVDLDAPFMDNENPFIDKLFVAGDSRANEQPLLTAFHTLFVREHNRLCDALKNDHPTWTDEAIYQHARRIVGGLIQQIVYNEWLPAMGVHLPVYQGYDDTVFPNISNVFSAAAFRLGHTLLNSNIIIMDDGGTTMDSVALKDAFFNPLSVAEHGLDPLLKGMGTQVEQDCDGKVVDDIRNFLFGPPQFGFGGLDLAAININRGRERGLPDFNTIRTDLGLTAYTGFSEINTNPSVFGQLQSLYNNVNNIDAWVGMLVENHMPDALFGETIMEIMVRQFQALRDGDRFYFEVDPVLTPAEKTAISNTTFRDVIMRNTGITFMQDNVFSAMAHDSICPASVANLDLTGYIQTVNGIEFSNVSVSLSDGSNTAPLNTITTETDGYFTFEQLETCEHYVVKPNNNEDLRNGVNTFDLLKIAKHILAIETFDSPYKIIAADVNNNGSVNVGDLVNLQQVILYMEDNFTNNNSWRFVDAHYNFINPTQPLVEHFPEEININYFSDVSQADFLAIKTGDINFDSDPNALLLGDTRDEKPFHFYIDDQKLEKGKTYTISFYSEDLNNIEGFQYTLNFDNHALELVNLKTGNLHQLDQNNFGMLPDKGAVTTSWFGNNNIFKEDQVFDLTFKAKQDGQLSELLSINSRFTSAEAYDKSLGTRNVVLAFRTDKTQLINPITELYQNIPNPFIHSTRVGFNLSEEGSAAIRIMDISGRVFQVIEGNYAKGYNEILIEKAGLHSGLYYYELKTSSVTLARKMIIL